MARGVRKEAADFILFAQASGLKSRRLFSCVHRLGTHRGCPSRAAAFWRELPGASLRWRESRDCLHGARSGVAFERKRILTRCRATRPPWSALKKSRARLLQLATQFNELLSQGYPLCGRRENGRAGGSKFRANDFQLLFDKSAFFCFVLVHARPSILLG